MVQIQRNWGISATRGLQWRLLLFYCLIFLQVQTIEFDFPSCPRFCFSPRIVHHFAIKNWQVFLDGFCAESEWGVASNSRRAAIRCFGLCGFEQSVIPHCRGSRRDFDGWLGWSLTSLVRTCKNTLWACVFFVSSLTVLHLNLCQEFEGIVDRFEPWLNHLTFWSWIVAGSWLSKCRIMYRWCFKCIDV